MTRQISLIVVSSVIFSFAGVSSEPSELGAATVGMATPTPIPDDDREERSENSLPTPPEPRPEVSRKLVDKELIIEWRQLFRKSGLNDLKRTKLAPDEIEIRVWEIPGLYKSKTQCWIFSRKAGTWTGSAIVDRKFSGRLTRVSLNELPSDSTEWDNYVNQNLSPQSIREAALTTDANYEGWMTVVEVKFGGDYERQGIANDKFLKRLVSRVKAEFFGNDDIKWSKF